MFLQKTFMTKEEFVAKVAEKAEVSKKESKEVVNAALEVLEEALVVHDTVSFVGFGTFTTVERNAREGVNPSTMEKINIPAKTAAKFKPSKTLNAKVNGD